MDNRNLWAPWRIGYLRSLDSRQKAAKDDGGCFLCEYCKHPEHDRENLVLWRGKTSFVVFNRFPYTGGHMMVAPAAHVANLGGLPDETLLEMMRLGRDVQTILTEAIRAQGFNMGINVQRCAGAGLPDHVHMHVVPRWEGDTNFMDVIGDVRVISQSLEELYDQLKTLSAKMNLPAAG